MTLYERILAATGPDRELDEAIWRAYARKKSGWHVDGDCPKFTASVDAALGLVGDSFPFDITRHTNGECDFRFWGEDEESAPTLPLAICAAVAKREGW